MSDLNMILWAFIAGTLFGLFLYDVLFVRSDDLTADRLMDRDE